MTEVTKSRLPEIDQVQAGKLSPPNKTDVESNVLKIVLLCKSLNWIELRSAIAQKDVRSVIADSLSVQAVVATLNQGDMVDIVLKTGGRAGKSRRVTVLKKVEDGKLIVREAEGVEPQERPYLVENIVSVSGIERAPVAAAPGKAKDVAVSPEPVREQQPISPSASAPAQAGDMRNSGGVPPAPAPKVAALPDEFWRAMMGESMGGNAGRGRIAVNYLHDGKRVVFWGNFQHASESVQAQYHSGVLKNGTLLLRPDVGSFNVVTVEQNIGDDPLSEMDALVNQRVTLAPAAPAAPARPPATVAPCSPPPRSRPGSVRRGRCGS
jgi:hypothetical protein